MWRLDKASREFRTFVSIWDFVQRYNLMPRLNMATVSKPGKSPYRSWATVDGIRCSWHSAVISLSASFSLTVAWFVSQLPHYYLVISLVLQRKYVSFKCVHRGSTWGPLCASFGPICNQFPLVSWADSGICRALRVQLPILHWPATSIWIDARC